MDPKEDQPTPEDLRKALQHAHQIFWAIDRALDLLMPEDPTWIRIQGDVRTYRESARVRPSPESDQHLLTLLDLLEGAIRDRAPTPDVVAVAGELSIAREFVQWMIQVSKPGGDQ